MASVTRPMDCRFSAIVPKPSSWQVSAPFCLPMPITIIFMSPLSQGPRKATCGLIRLTTTIPSASAANRSRCTGNPLAETPISTVSMLARMGAPTVSSVMPMPASMSRWPSAVAPPWLPMAGNRKGSPPALRISEAMVFRTSGRPVMPRLPAVMATRSPAFTRASAPPARSFATSSPATSATCGRSKLCRTLTRRGMGMGSKSLSMVLMLNLGVTS